MPENEVASILEILKANTPLPNKPIAQLRADFTALYLRLQNISGLSTHPADIPKLSAFWIDGPGSVTSRVLLFFHGGGFTIGSTRDHLGLCGKLRQTADARVLSVDYRLAPEHPFPAAVEDCVAAYRWLRVQGYNPAEIVPVGISSGGTLVLSTLIALRDRGEHLPAAAVCMSPAVDLLFRGRSVITNQGKDWISSERLKSIRKVYLGRQDPELPLASPIAADLKGLPPLLIQVGSHELLLDGNRDFVVRAEEAGGTVAFEVWEGMIHCWQVFADRIPEGQSAIEHIGRYIREHVPVTSEKYGTDKCPDSFWLI